MEKELTITQGDRRKTEIFDRATLSSFFNSFVLTSTTPAPTRTSRESILETKGKTKFVIFPSSILLYTYSFFALIKLFLHLLVLFFSLIKLSFYLFSSGTNIGCSKGSPFTKVANCMMTCQSI